MDSSDGASPDGPIFVRAMETLDPSGLLKDQVQIQQSNADDSSRQVFKVVDESDRRTSRDGEDDIQIMRLDDETRNAETYERINGADVLKLEQYTNQDPEQNPDQIQDDKVVQDAATSPRRSEINNGGEEGIRTLSELELLRQRHNLEDDEGEFYTAIGPDGK